MLLDYKFMIMEVLVLGFNSHIFEFNFFSEGAIDFFYNFVFDFGVFCLPFSLILFLKQVWHVFDFSPVFIEVMFFGPKPILVSLCNLLFELLMIAHFLVPNVTKC